MIFFILVLMTPYFPSFTRNISGKFAVWNCDRGDTANVEDQYGLAVIRFAKNWIFARAITATFQVRRAVRWRIHPAGSGSCGALSTETLNRLFFCLSDRGILVPRAASKFETASRRREIISSRLAVSSPDARSATS